MATSSTSASHFPVLASASLSQSILIKRKVGGNKIGSKSVIKVSKASNSPKKVVISRSPSNSNFPDLKNWFESSRNLHGQPMKSKVQDSSFRVTTKNFSMSKLSPAMDSKSKSIKELKASKHSSFSHYIENIFSQNEQRVNLEALPSYEPGLSKADSTSINEGETTATASDPSPKSKGKAFKSPTHYKRPALMKLKSAIDSLTSDDALKEPNSDYFVRHLRSKSHYSLPKSPFNNYTGVLYVTKSIEILKSMQADRIIYNPPKRIHPRKYPDRKLLVLDLDETLIHCSGDKSLATNFDEEVEFVTPEGVQLTGFLNIRPHAIQFLENISKHYEVIIFTASMQYYADTIVDILDPFGKFVSALYYRESCSRTSSNKLVKDLSIFENIPLSDMILVDNNIYCMWLQPQNGVPILHFEFDRNDRELLSLETFLVQLHSVRDHMVVLNYHFMLPHLFKTLDKKKYLGMFTN